MSDNNNGLLLIGAAALAYIVLKKKGAIPGAMPAPQGNSQNINGDLWARLLGTTAWKSLLQSGSTNAGNSLPFFRNDGFGNLSTSDGTPITTGDPLADFVTKNTGLPAVYDDTAKYTTGDWLSGNNPLISPSSAFSYTPAGQYSTWESAAQSGATGGLGAVMEEM